MRNLSKMKGPRDMPSNKTSRRKSRSERTARSVVASKPKPWGTITAVVAIVVLAAVVFGYIGVLSKRTQDEAAAQLEAAIAESERPFGQNYRTLAERTKDVFPPGTPMTGPHVHPSLGVFVDGEPIEVPANIGIHPDQAGHAPVHTHDTDGTLHIEGPAGTTLGQVFQVWGVKLSATRLGPHEASDHKAVRMWVDGEPTRAFGDLELVDEQRIVIAYGDPAAPPPGEL